MIVSESDTLAAALDRRLAVDRILALDPLAAVDPDGGASRPAGPSAGAVADATAARQAANTGLVPGALVAARVDDAPTAGHVLVDIGGLRVALAWPAATGQAPAVGRDLALRVVATEPTLAFETLPDASVDGRRADDAPRLSADALLLQSSHAQAGGATRFSMPLLSTTAPTTDEPAGHAAPPSTATALVVQTPLAPTDRVPVPGTLLPLGLAGPAWPGQDVELVVRRERADEAFDNAALDQWCGEIVIDLPALGRVAGHLAWSLQGLRLRLEGEDAASAAVLAAATAELAAALGQADLPVLALTVARPLAASSGATGRG